MLENSSLINAVREVTDSRTPLPQYRYSCSVRLPDGRELVPLRVVSTDIARDYLKTFADESYITIVFGVGTYSKYIYPNKERLSVQLTREVIGDHATADDEPIITREYKAVLCETKDIAAASGSGILDNVEVADSANVANVRLQLIDRSVEWLRSVSVGGSFRKRTAADLLLTLLTVKTQEIPREVVGTQGRVDMVPPDNLEPRDHIVVPHGKPLVELADFLQEECGGIYNTGLGIYLLAGDWYVWPALNTKRFDQSPRGLTVINVPEEKMPSIERTWLTKGNQLIVLSTGRTDITDTSDKAKLDKGIGIRFNDAKGLLDSFVHTVGNVAKASRGKNVTEVLIDQAVEGLAHVTRGAKATSNLFAELSKTVFRKGNNVTATWENSDHTLLYPGMPVRFMYEHENQVRIRYGVLVGDQHFISMEGRGGTSQRFKSNTALYLFLDKEEE